MGMDMGMDMDAQEEDASVVFVLHAQGYIPEPLPLQRVVHRVIRKGFPPDDNDR